MYHNLIVCTNVQLYLYTVHYCTCKMYKTAHYNSCYSEYFNINAHLPIKCVADEVIIAVLSELQ